MVKYLAKFERWSFGVHYTWKMWDFDLKSILLIMQHEITQLFLLMFDIKHKKPTFFNKHLPNSTHKPAWPRRYHTAARCRPSPRKVLHQTIFKSWQACNTSGGPATQKAAAQSHTSELTRGLFCFRVSTDGPWWAPQVSRASSGWPGAGKTKGSTGPSLSLHISVVDYSTGSSNLGRTGSQILCSNL